MAMGFHVAEGDSVLTTARAILAMKTQLPTEESHLDIQPSYLCADLPKTKFIVTAAAEDVASKNAAEVMDDLRHNRIKKARRKAEEDESDEPPIWMQGIDHSRRRLRGPDELHGRRRGSAPKSWSTSVAVHQHYMDGMGLSQAETELRHRLTQGQRSPRAARSPRQSSGHWSATTASRPRGESARDRVKKLLRKAREEKVAASRMHSPRRPSPKGKAGRRAKAASLEAHRGKIDPLQRL